MSIRDFSLLAWGAAPRRGHSLAQAWAARSPELSLAGWRFVGDEELPAPTIRLTLQRDQDTSHLLAPLLDLLAETFAEYAEEEVPLALFEHTLSEGGTFRIHVAPDLSARLVKTTWARPRTLEAGSTLSEVLAYSAAHHWYE